MTKRIASALIALACLAPSLAVPSAAEARGGQGGGAARGCLTAPARALLAQIEARFGPMKLVSTCRPGATIAGTGRPSRHASGNAVDFDAGARKGEVVQWLVANHRAGGTMTYAGMSHVHVDLGPHFVSLAGGMKQASLSRRTRAAQRAAESAQSASRPALDSSERMSLGAGRRTDK